MVSVFTPNIQAESPARGDDVGTWDNPPYDNNNTMYDLIGGGTATIVCSGTQITLLSSQYRCKHLQLTGALTASLSIVFPSSFKKDYEIQHLCTNTSAFFVNATNFVPTGTFIGLPPGEVVGIMNDGTNVKFKSLDRIGSYFDHGSSSVPNWVQGSGTITSSSGASVAYPTPYLSCDGTTFSSSTYPALAEMLGGTTLPDTRGRTRGTLNQATGRMNAGIGGVNGDVLLAAGGTEKVTLAAASIPAISAAGSNTFNSTATAVLFGALGVTTAFGGVFGVQMNGLTNALAAQLGTNNTTVNVTSTNTGGLGHVNAQPTYVGGITMIRAY